MGKCKNQFNLKGQTKLKVYVNTKKHLEESLSAVQNSQTNWQFRVLFSNRTSIKEANG